MFTETERLRAIELYFKYGRKLAPVVRELGYPSKRNLRRWSRLREASDGATEAIRRKPRYTDMQKQTAVEHYLNHGCCLAFTSRTLGYPCGDVLARRVNELYASCIGHHDAGSLRGSTPPAYAFIHHHAPPLVEGRVHYISPVSAPVI